MKYKLNYKLLIAAPLLLVVIGAITVLALSRLLPQHKSAPTAQIVVPDSADIIKQFQAAGAVGELANLYTKKKATEPGTDIINYTADKSYTVYVKATDTVQFEQNDKVTTTNSPSVKTHSEKFLVDKGLQKISPANGAAAQLFTIFDSSQTTCQLFDSPLYSKSSAMLTLACVKKSVVNDQYRGINKLLALYSGQVSIASPTGITLRTVKDGNKSLSVTDVYGIKSDSGAASLIFAAIDDKWEYIGQRAISSGDTVVDGSISPELKTKLGDPRYQDFLKKNVQQ